MSVHDSKPPLRLLFDWLASVENRDERAELIDFTCRGDPALRARLERLLALRHKADDYFDFQSPVAAPVTGAEDDVNEGKGTWVGRYRLLGRLGEGGCGVVYLAEQQEPVKRRVALKIIRLGMDTENVIARFEMERQALALMDHPNIARVLDVGTTKSGRPFFVMQLVDGDRITDYCDNKRLGINERLRLFIRICQAVQHAHQKGVIHRDIKPSNVLVWEHDGEAVPKVIDFGIAKATAAGIDLQVTVADDCPFVGTPAYMSPEQACGSGLAVDTRSDVYSLGALLYELLSGCPPFDPSALRASTTDEIRAMLRDLEPSKPSQAVEKLGPDVLREAAEQRNCEPRKLAAKLKGDLDRIVMKAMAKERQRRHAGADALAADVMCFLNHEPVSAQPPGGFYRLGKLVRRNKGVFAASALVVISLLIGLGAATVMYFRADHARVAAELARANEAALRRKAEIGQDISMAAVLLKYGKIGDADALIADIPPAEARPSLESAQTFRELGRWHAREGRWPQAAKRFAALAYALAYADQTDSDTISIDLQPAASSLCEAGDWEGYESLRAMAADRFGGTSNAIVAEQVVKACLLRPASPEFLAKLTRLENLMLVTEADSPQSTPQECNLTAWREFALALLEYRRGNLNASLDWIGKAMGGTSKNPARDAIARTLRAMIFQRQNRSLEAETELAAARLIIGECAATEPFDQKEPVWQDWVNVRILIREAQGMLDE